MSGDPDQIPPFSSADLIKVMAATYLPLCRTLEAQGVLNCAILARKIAVMVPADEQAPWAQLVLALSESLAAPPPPPIEPSSPPRRAPSRVG